MKVWKQTTLAVCLILFFCSTSIASPHLSRGSDFQKYLLEVYINQSATKQIIHCFIDKDRQIWIHSVDLRAWHLSIPDNEPLFYEHKAFYQLDWVKEIKYHFDQENLSLFLDIPTQYLPKTTIYLQPREEIGTIRPQHPGAFANYSLSLQHNNLISETNFAAFTELGHFNQFGVGTSDFIANKNISDNNLIRLDTTWTLDQPEKLTSWRFGDSISGSSIWAGQVHFAGVQWATNFSTQPYFITFPLPTISGEAIVPSTLDIFVNDTLRFTQNIESGPFTVYEMPVVTGEGTIKLVNQNNGLRQEVLIPYYASEQLLKPALSDFSYELGFIRDDFGIDSFHYSDLVAVGSYSQGLQENWTAGWHGELLSRQQTFGISSNYLWQNALVASFSLATSHSDLGIGSLALFGLRRITPSLSFGAQLISTSKTFTQLGFISQQPPMLRLKSYLSYASAKYGSFGISYTRIKNRYPVIFDDFSSVQELFNTDLMTVSYSKNLFTNVYLLLGAITDFHHHHHDQMVLSIVCGLPHDNSLTVSQQQSRQSSQSLQLIKNVPLGNGYGYNLFASHHQPQEAQASFTYQNDYGTYTAGVVKFSDYSNYLAQASGGIIHFADHTLLSRNVYNSFTLVEVPGYENVCVYDRNTCIGRTNHEGVLLVPNSLAYQRNKIAIEPTDLPLTAQIGTTELDVIPYYRSGILARFPVQSVYNLSMRLVNETRKPLIAGATVHIYGDSQTYFIGENGYFFTAVTGTTLVGEVKSTEGACAFHIRTPLKKNAITDLGDIMCFSTY
ncbi:MAG: fimbrial biogenesis outer membrane usher protein [Proteobacteria bacterium]|nr:fimbrial biogenesis outer membrane usher protein [Pseudomonadota bacterium]